MIVKLVFSLLKVHLSYSLFHEHLNKSHFYFWYPAGYLWISLPVTEPVFFLGQQTLWLGRDCCRGSVIFDRPKDGAKSPKQKYLLRKTFCCCYYPCLRYSCWFNHFAEEYKWLPGSNGKNQRWPVQAGAWRDTGYWHNSFRPEHHQYPKSCQLRFNRLCRYCKRRKSLQGCGNKDGGRITNAMDGIFDEDRLHLTA
jgi:hypothetical protein